MSYSAQEMSHNLHRVNARLSETLQHLGVKPLVSPDQIGALLSDLLQIGQCLSAAKMHAAQGHSELATELSTYRSNVERLKQFLPTIHSCLLQERGRLEDQRSRIQAATAWAEASRQTL